MSVKKLLDLGAKCDPRNKQGLSPLVMAAARGCGPAVVALVRKGADSGLVLSGGSTVLHMSADMGVKEVCWQHVAPRRERERESFFRGTYVELTSERFSHFWISLVSESIVASLYKKEAIDLAAAVANRFCLPLRMALNRATLITQCCAFFFYTTAVGNRRACVCAHDARTPYVCGLCFPLRVLYILLQRRICM